MSFTLSSSQELPTPAADGVLRDAFFRRLAVADSSVQKTIIQVVQQELCQLMEENPHQLADYYPTIVRLAREAPFDAVRESMVQLQLAIHDRRIVVGDADGDVDRYDHISYFIDDRDIEHVAGNDDAELIELFQAEYLRTGRVSHFVQLLAWHKSYLRLYQQLIVSVMVRDGVLPHQWRSYIALMAASELRCHYLADLQQYYFVVNGGEPEWIKGIDYVPAKLFQLHELSSMLAHRPWLVTADHISELLTAESGDAWSLAELVHAIVVMVHYHSMSSVSLGLGCREEDDLSVWSHDGSEAAEKRVIRYLERSISDDTCESTSSSRSGSDSAPDMDVSSMERDESQLLTLLRAAGRRGGDLSSNASSVEAGASNADDFEFEIVEEHDEYDFSSDCNSRRRDTLWRFCGGRVLRYADFDVRSQDYSVLHTEDFSWAEHAFSLIRRYFSGATGQILEDQFTLTSRLTYDFYGAQKEEEVDTTPYRNAIWYYVHRIFGICHDDYDYRQVNVYLNRPTKIFIKKVACTPWKVTKDDFEHFDRTLSPPEKCHVTLLVAEARKQAGLMYGLRAVMQHMK